MQTKKITTIFLYSIAFFVLGYFLSTLSDSTISVFASGDETKMRMHFIDVGQGDATLLEFPCGAVLVDTGSESNGDFNGNDALTVYLDDFFERRKDLNYQINLLVLTHPHSDHTKGVTEILQKYKVKNVITNGQTNGSGIAQQKKLTQYAQKNEDNSDPSQRVGFETIKLADIPDDGLTDEIIDPIKCKEVDPKITALWGQITSSQGFNKGTIKDNNNHSIALRIDFGKASVLLPGDLTADVLPKLVERYKKNKLLDTDVFHVDHHGSANGVTPEYISAITPKFAIISMGPASRELPWTAWAFGHPRKDTISKLNAINTTLEKRSPINVKIATGQYKFEDTTIKHAIYATGWDGTIVLEADTNGTYKIAESSAASTLININSASAEELEKLPCIGKTKAMSIINYRKDNGLFNSIDDLLKVNGIGHATLESIREYITITTQ